MKISTLGKHPLDRIARLFRDVHESADFLCQSYDEKYPSLEAVQRELNESISLGAELGGTLGGFVSFQVKTEARLSHTAAITIGLAPRAQGRGIGKALLEAALQRAVEDGVEILYAMIRADNTASLKLFERAGFARLATLADDTKVGERYYDGILLSRRTVELSGRTESRTDSRPADAI